MKMASSRTFTLLCGLLAATLVGATLSPPAVIMIGPKIIREKLAEKLKDHDANQILQDLPLLSTLQEEPAGGIPILGNLVNSVLSHIVWLKVTSADIKELQVQPSADDQEELVVNIPLDLVAGFNTPLAKSIVELHMETEVQATISVDANKKGFTVSSCSDNGRSLRISLLKKVSFMVNPLANGVMKLLVPALPKLVQSQLCPVIEEAFEDMEKDLLQLVEAPIPVSDENLQFDLLSSAIKDDAVQLNLEAKLLDSQGTETKRFRASEAPLTIPFLDSAPFGLTLRKDVVKDAIKSLLRIDDIKIMLHSVLPELALKLKNTIKGMSEQASAQLMPSQFLKVLTHDHPELSLEKDRVKLAQQIVLQLFASDDVLRPLITLGIEAVSEAKFLSKGAELILNLTGISADRIRVLNSNIPQVDTTKLKKIVEEILAATLQPNQNGKLSHGISVAIAKALGLKDITLNMNQDSIVVSADYS